MLLVFAGEFKEAPAATADAGQGCLVIDGTLIPIDRVATTRPFDSGKHCRHGMNLQVIVSRNGDTGECPGHCPAPSPT
jgi:hypothetical protein